MSRMGHRFGCQALDLVEEAHFDESHSEVLEILRQLQCLGVPPIDARWKDDRGGTCRV